jgi:N-glycosylase/DNA lyase
LRSSLLQNFNPEISVNSGQVFLWEKHGDCWYGIHGSQVIKFARKPDGSFEFQSFPEGPDMEKRIFRLDDDIEAIFSEISRDPFVAGLLKDYSGLRLMRQNPEQCLFSFVCASNTNIPMIRRMLYSLTRKFGQKLHFDGRDFFTFPTAAQINAATVDDLQACGLGYRAKAVKAVAESITGGSLDLDFLIRSNYQDAKNELLKVYGVGNKIADCVLLFSLEKTEAFPIDVWIARALAGHYRWLHNLPISDKITSHQYDVLSERLRGHFGKYSGYAQQYIYYHMRQQAGKKW